MREINTGTKNMEVLLTTFNRAKYLKPSIDSLLNSDIGDSTIHVYDDCSDQPKALDIVKSLEQHPRFEVNYNKTNLGCDFNIVQAARKVIEKTGCNYIVTTDSDTLYNKNWLNFLESQVEKPGVEDSVAAISLFNAPSHPVVGEFDDELNVKESLGGMTVAVKSSYFFEMDETTDTLNKPWFCWDWEVVYSSQDKGELLLCSKSSMVQHIGRFGAHSRGDGHFDTSEDFIGE